MEFINLLKNIAAQINASDPPSLEGAMRSALIYYHMRVSNQAVLEFTGSGKTGNLNLKTPIQFHGQGKIMIGTNVVFGVLGSPSNLSHSYFEARSKESVIRIGDNTALNNHLTFISDGAGISIGKNCLIGQDCIINDTNGHELAVARRLERDSNPRPVTIGNDVFIGARVIILKGVTVGDGCVISAGAVLFPGFTAEANKVIAGNPAQIIKDVPQD